MFAHDSKYVEGLRDRVLSAAKRPTLVPSVQTDARLSTTPFADVPSKRGKFSASRARPGKQSNQVVPYTRVVNSDASDIAPGDVVFVKQGTASAGKISPVVSLRRMNAMLAAAGQEATLKYKDMGVTGAQRSQKWLEANHAELYRLDAHGPLDVRQPPEVAYRPGRIKTKIEFEPTDRAFVPIEWRSVPLLRDWKLDGVLLVGEDAELVGQPGGGESTVALNVAVQGPVAVSNSGAQLFDASARASESLYVILSAKTVDITGDARFAFEFSVCSDRTLDAMANRPATEPTPLSRCCAAWRLGRAIDSRLVRGTHTKLQVNVAIQEIGLAHRLCDSTDADKRFFCRGRAGVLLYWGGAPMSSG